MKFMDEVETSINHKKKCIATNKLIKEFSTHETIGLKKRKK